MSSQIGRGKCRRVPEEVPKESSYHGTAVLRMVGNLRTYPGGLHLRSGKIYLTCTDAQIRMIVDQRLRESTLLQR